MADGITPNDRDLRSGFDGHKYPLTEERRTAMRQLIVDLNERIAEIHKEAS